MSADGQRPEPAGGQGSGHPAVDAVLARLAELDRLDLAEHPARFEELHAALQDVLAGTPPPDDR